MTAIAVTTLTLGIGASTAVFSLVNGILIRPLPFPEPGRLAGLWHTAPGIGFPQVEQSDATYLNYREHLESFEDIGLYTSGTRNLTEGGDPERVEVVHATASLFDVLGVPASLGRSFSPEEDRPGAEPVAVLSHALWSRRFGSDPAIVGKTVHLSGVATAVVGVMPPGFQFPGPSTQLWIPLAIDRSQYKDSSFSYYAVGRLREGVSLERAEAEMVPVLARLPENFPGDLTKPMMEQARFAPVLHSLKTDVVGEVETPLLILLGTVGFVLLVATANVANLFLVRAEGRHREIAVRRAIGASRREIARLYLSESLLLGAVGGALGLALAYVVVRFFVSWGAVDLPRLEEVRIDASVLVFTGIISVVAGIFFGAVPVLRHESASPAAGLNEIGRGLTAGRERLSARGLLVVSQVALALVLLVGSGLMARSFFRLRTVDPGFDPSSTLTFALSLPENAYPSGDEVERFLRALTERVESLPGVVALGTTTRLPLTGSYDNNALWIEDFPVPEGQIPPVLPTRQVSPGYFRAVGIPLLSGRTFEWSDRENGVRAVVVSSAFAEKYWKKESPLGKRLRPFNTTEPFLIVGVVGSARDEGLEREPSLTVYFPAPQPDDVRTSLQVAVRTRIPPDSVFESVREEIRALDRSLPISGVGTMEEIAARSIARTRFTMILLAIAAGVAVLLGSIGIYGVVSCIVSLRRNEIGIRMALGARGLDVQRMFISNGMKTALVGTAAGLAGALAVTRVLETLLFEVEAFDPLVYVLASLAMLLIAAAASALPARRAARLDPLLALRSD